MSQPSNEALAFLHGQIEDLTTIQARAKKTTNAMAETEKFLQWKKETLALISQNVGETFAKQLTGDWLEVTFAGGDVFEELEDDIDMCLRHIKKLARDIERSSPPSL
ncbi:MAG: hypothetical protein GKS05_03360 [Nitrospirales bacterium]|nr:hypothetical protein [Nitrospirales bacterium]